MLQRYPQAINPVRSIEEFVRMMKGKKTTVTFRGSIIWLQRSQEGWDVIYAKKGLQRMHEKTGDIGYGINIEPCDECTPHYVTAFNNTSKPYITHIQDIAFAAYDGEQEKLLVRVEDYTQ